MEVDSPEPSLTIAAACFAALGSEQRLTVLLALVRAGPAGLSIGALGAATGVTGSTLTHHMKILAAAGLVEQSRQGRNIICAAVAYARVHSLSHFLLTQCCADAETPCLEHGHKQGPE
jgi:DNA-binding transcriptional ArsR family regulator